MARGLRRSRMNAIGMLVAIRTTSFFEDHCHGPITEAAIIAAEHREQSVSLYFQKNFPEKPENISLYCDGRCDGLIVVGESTPGPFVSALKNRSFPFVCVTEAEVGCDVSYTDADQEEMAERLAVHLLELGHRKILVLEGVREQINVRQRIVGSSRAFAKWGISPMDTPFLPGAYDKESGYERVYDHLTKTPRQDWPTAIYCFNDFLAHGALLALSDLGVQCPSEMSVVGIDNDRESVTAVVPLTTMRLPLQLLGQNAVDMLLTAINNPGSPIQQLNLPAELIIRDSTAPPRPS